MTRILRLLLIAAIALPIWQPVAAQDQDAEKQAEFEKARIAAETGQSLDVNVPIAPKPSNDATKQNAPKDANRSTLTKIVSNGTQTSSYAPVYGFWFDYGTTTQMIYPASTLGLANGDIITGLKFYSSSNTISSGISSATVTVQVGNTDDSEVGQSLTAIQENREDEDIVFEGNLTVSGSEMSVTFDHGYVYTGSNLLVDFQAPRGGSAASTTWYGATAPSNSFVCVYGSSSSVVNSSNTSFLPKMEITYQHVDAPYKAILDGIGAFGVIQKGTSETSTFTVTNEGSNAFTPRLTISQNSSAFSVSGDMNTQLASGESREFTVTFTPATATTYTGTLTLSAPESPDITGSAPLSGEGSSTAIVADGEETNRYVPVWGYNYDDNTTHHQMIYPASMLGDVAGKKIKSITFYPNSDGVKFGGGELTVTMGTTSVSAFSSADFLTITGTTTSVDIVPTQGDQIMHIEFGTPFEYTSGNLIIDTKVKTAATYGSTYWYGETTDDYQSYYYCGSSSYGGSNRLQFLPKITFELIEEVTVNKTQLTFGDVAVGTDSEAQTVTVGNSTGNNVALSWTFSNDKFSTTATANTVQAGSVVEIPVVFTPTAAGEQTGTLTINAGGKTFTVSLSGNGVAAYAANVDQQTINFGGVAVEGNVTATVTLTNTGMNDITPTFTQPAEPFSVTGVEGKLASGESRTYTIAFAPEQAGNFSGTFTIADADHDISYTVTLSGVGVVLDPITANPASLDFGTVNKGSTKDLTVAFTNPNSEQVAVTLTAPAGYSVSPSSFNIAANGSQTVTVTFAPTAAVSYYGTLTANGSGLNIDVTLKGVGRVEGEPAAIRDKEFFEGINYDWTDSQGASHTSNLAEIATDPDQIIAMLRKVYMDQTIPGNYHRGFTSTGGTDHDEVVNYSAVGTLTTGSTALSSFADTYGWNIQPESGDILSSGSYYYLNPNQFKPNDEGVTLLLLEIVDNFDPNTSHPTSDPTHDYNKLRTYFSTAIKSARIVTEAKRVGDKADFSSGTMFKIDCDKMNKFYLIAKGQLAWLKQREDNSNSTSATSYSFSYPFYYSSGGGWLDYGLSSTYFNMEPAFLCHMFEQLSPAEGNSESPLEDGYQLFVTEMSKFGINHDCPNVPFVLGKGHHFMMYGEDSDAADCADIRDMMFFVPDYRMMDWDYRGSKSSATTSSNRTQDYFYYNENHQPTLGVFVIQQNEIPEGTVISSNQQTMTGLYKHQLSWKSNLDDFLPGEEQEYQLWEIVVDEFGIESYQPVYYRNAQGQYTDAAGTVVSKPVPIVLERVDLKEFTFPSVYVDMTAGSQTKTYVIRGRDKDGFLSLQMSNQQEIVIPGLDPNEKAHMIGATYYSRYNPKNQKNCYSNRLELSNNGMQLTADDLSNPIKFYRSSRAAQVDANGNVVTDANGNIQYAAEVKKELVATATATTSGNTGTLTVELANQGIAGDYPRGVTSGTNAGYHDNTTLQFTYRIRNGVVYFNNNFQFWDNFTVDVSKNAHPLQYLYKMEVAGAGLATVTLDAAACSVANTNEAWGAWTWPASGGDGEWAEGTSLGDNKFMFTGIPGKNKIKFVRMNGDYSGELPNWDAKWNESEEYLVSQGSTCTLKGYYENGSGIMWGSWTGATNGNAYSNEVRVPVYKTDSKINSYTSSQVDGDTGGNVELKDMEFQAKVQLSSKSEILRYDAYRWSDSEIAALARENSQGVSIIDKVNGDDEEDIAPTGMAGNQGEWYTVSMNDVSKPYYYSAPVEDQPEVSTDQPNNWANFIDRYPNYETVTTANEYLYAPVVELFTKGYKQGTTEKRKDYNSYGGPQQTAAAGKLEVEVPQSGGYEISGFSWLKGGNRYAYYNVQLRIKQDDIPAGYEVYRVRAWREIDTDLLDEPMAQFADRKVAKYLFEDLKGSEYQQGQHMVIGGESIGNGEEVIQDDNGNSIPVYRGTFGARKVSTSTQGQDDLNDGCVESLDMKFKVRMYFTRTSTKADGDEQDTKPYYIVEYEYPFTIQGGIPTAVEGISNSRQVVGVKYYNVAGIESDTPFDGVNIMVTRYSDGSTSTVKVLK